MEPHTQIGLNYDNCPNLLSKATNINMKTQSQTPPPMKEKEKHLGTGDHSLNRTRSSENIYKPKTRTNH